MYRQKKEWKKGPRKKVVSLHIQVYKHACVIIIESEMKTEFSPETAPLICFSVSQSDLCQEVNAVRAWKIACTLFLMGNIWYSLTNGMMFLSHSLSQSKTANQSEPIKVPHHKCLKSKYHWIIFSSFHFDNPSRIMLLYRGQPAHLIISQRQQTQAASTTGKV